MKYVNVQGELDRVIRSADDRSNPSNPLALSVDAPLAQRVATVTSSLDEPVSPSEYLLVCTAQSTQLGIGSWYFSLEAADGQPVLEASDEEAGDLNRLTLLAAVRGLEAIDGSSAVTLLSHNRYLIRSLADSLPRWRENNFVWEHFGRRIDVQHAGLWRRIDHALSIHRVEACLVSSRLVSRGIKSPQSPQTQSPQTQSPQTQSPQTQSPSSKQSIETGDQTFRFDQGHPSVPAPARWGAGASDRLRQWLLTDASAGRQPTMKNRFTAADLMETG